MGLRWQCLLMIVQAHGKWIATLICLLATGLFFAHHYADQQIFFWQKKLMQVTDKHKHLNMQLRDPISKPTTMYDAKQALLLLQVITVQKPQAVFISQFNFTMQSGLQIGLQSTNIKALKKTIEIINCLSFGVPFHRVPDITKKILHQQHFYYYQMALQPKSMNRADCYA